MPIPGQLFVADLLCGYMWAWYDWLEPRAREEHGYEYIKLYEAGRACNYVEMPIVTGVHQKTHVGYVCSDYGPRTRSGTANGWLKPHFNFDWASTAHELPVVDLTQAAGLSMDHLMLALLCAPCKTHSVSNYANITSALGDY